MTEQNQSLPEGWFETNLGQIIVLLKEKVNPLELDEIPYISLEHIESGTCRINGHGWAKDVKSTKSVFQAGQILYGRLRPYLNKVFKPDFSGICSTDILVLKGTGAIDNDFLLRFLSQNSVVQYATSRSSGINLPRVSFTALTELPINLPPLNEQKRIANQINLLKEKSSSARKALEATPPLLEKFRQSVLASAFRGDLTADWRAQNPDIEPAEKLLERIRKERRKRWEEDELAKMKAKGKTPKDDKWKKKYKEPEPVDNIDLPELPEGWCWGPLEILGIHQSGIAYKSKDFTNSGIQVIKLGNLYQGRFDLSRDPTFLPQDHPAVFEGLLHQGDLIISQTGTRFKRDYGNFVIIPDDADKLVLNQRLLRVRLVESSLAKWVLYTTRLTFYRDYFFSRETGGVNQGNVGVEGVMRGPIPFAPYQEMKVILRQIEDITKYTENIEAISRKEIRNLSQLDQSTLSKAFRGELVSQDPNDEPASVLLERIKQEKASLESGKKKRARRSRTAKR